MKGSWQDGVGNEKRLERHNSLFDTQIIVTSQLDSTDNNWLKSLCTDITQELYLGLYDDIQNRFNDRERAMAKAVVQLVSNANHNNIEIWKEDNTMCQALKEIMRSEFEEDIKESFNDGFNDGFKKGEIQSRIKTYYECGVTPDDIAQKVDCSLEYVNEVLGI